MEIVGYRDMGKLSHEEIAEIASLEANIFKYKPFGEYKICEDINCRKLVSYEEDSEENICPCCKSKTVHYSPVDNLTKYLQFLYAQNTAGAIIKDDSNKIVGASIGFVSNFDNAFNSINYRGGYNRDDFLSLAKTRTGRNLSPNTQVVCANRIVIDKKHRGSGLYSHLLRVNLNELAEYDNLPAIGDTMIETKLFPLVIASGYLPTQFDRFGGVGLATSDFGKFRDRVNMPDNEFEKRYKAELQKARRLQRQLKLRCAFSEKKYIGTQLLSDIFP